MHPHGNVSFLEMPPNKKMLLPFRPWTSRVSRLVAIRQEVRAPRDSKHWSRMSRSSVLPSVVRAFEKWTDVSRRTKTYMVVTNAQKTADAYADDGRWPTTTIEIHQE